MKKVIKINLILLLSGVIYIWWLKKTGMGIPCLFHMYTGFYCPGCGMTHAMMALAQIDFELAFKYHWAFVLSLPCLIYLYAIVNYRYVCNGKIFFRRFENIMMIAIITIFIIRMIVINF